MKQNQNDLKNKTHIRNVKVYIVVNFDFNINYNITLTVSKEVFQTFNGFLLEKGFLMTSFQFLNLSIIFLQMTP
jgi:hypothetical protein